MADTPTLAWDNFYVIVGSSAGALTGLQLALVMIATMAMLLLLVGIHNAWDTVTFIVVQRR